jgi:hypothetical protein
MTIGCPLRSAKRHPDKDETISVSGIPINPSVLSSERKISKLFSKFFEK